MCIMTQMSIIFLGTGGSWPSVHRNVSATAVKRGSDVILFDCGEGTQRQIQKSSLSYMQISTICITHFHGDHILGLPGLIQTMQLNDREKPLHIYGPQGIDVLIDQIVHLGYFSARFPIFAHELTDGDVVKSDGYMLKAVSVSHNVPALAYVFEEYQRPGKFNKVKALELGVPEGPLFSKLQKGKTVTLENGKRISSSVVLGPSRPGRKLVFSGDTTVSDTLCKAAHHADVLVHEATFSSDMEETASDYGHSTAKQAAELAKKAQVNRLYLTHISPRYLDVSALLKEAQEVFPDSCIVRDFQEVEVKYSKN